jgi:2-polyprenyl-6-methoxyphenol hydroxylase-like FAD-dependent oxidoreductase
MFGKQQSDVLVAGAGPTGLLTALHLARAGVSVRILDKHWRTGAHSYALALHARSLELLEPLGLVPALLEHGRRVDRVAFWESGQALGRVSLAELGGPFPFVLVLPQSALEGELENRLLAAKVRVLWNHRLERLHEEADGLVAEVARLDRVASGYPIARSEWIVVKSRTERARYAVGADGYHSMLREQLGYRFEQHGALETFSVFELEGDRDPGGELSVMFEGEMTSAIWPMPGTRCRYSFQISHPSQHDPSLNRLNEYIRERAPWLHEVRGEVAWASMVQFDRRLATGMGRNRLWLVGDAVHLTGPIGVQSMNSGLVDAHELAWRLAAVVRGERGPDVLVDYESERMAELRRLFHVEGLAAPDSGPEWARRRWSRVVSSIPATGAHLDALLGQLA